MSSLKLRDSFNSRHTVMQITILFWLTAPFFGLGVDDFPGGYLLDHKNLKFFLLDNNEVKLEIPKIYMIKLRFAQNLRV